MRVGKALFLLVVVVFLAAFAGCGKKGPPFVPGQRFEAKVAPLSAEWKDGSIHLFGPVVNPRENGKIRPGLTHCKVYHVRYDLDDPPCEGCPIRYPDHSKIKGRILPDDVFGCDFPLEKKRGIHFFEVRLIGGNGETGPPSNRIKLVVQL